MHRRAFLSAIGATALGGCQAVGPLPFEEAGPRTVERASAETNYDVALSLSASVLQETITADEQARVEFTARWDGAETARFRNFPALHYTSSDPRGIWLLRPERDTERRNRKAWVPAEESTSFQGGLPTFEFAPGESITREFEVWADPYEASRIRPGSYSYDGRHATRVSGWGTLWNLQIDVVRAD